MDYKIIAVDFDGTLCENAWPDIGEPITEVFDYIKRQQEEGAQIILWTCREGQKLLDAVYWCNKRGLYFNAINQNVPSIIEAFGGDCRKIYADVYIDDLSFNHRPFELRFEKSFETVLQEYVDAGYSVKIVQIDPTFGNTCKVTLTKNGVKYNKLCTDNEKDILFGMQECKWHLDRALRRKNEKAKNLNG